jgi:small subunit ribosomal protein S1
MPRDLEDEINEALAGVSMDQFLGQDDAAIGTGTELQPDQRYQATVVKIFRDNIFCRLPGQHEGVASTKNMENVPEVGTELEVVVSSFNADEGLYELRVPGTAVDVEDWSDLSEGTVVEARVTGHNSGGLECDVSGIRGFMPISQISLYRVEDVAQFVDEKFTCLVTEANPARGNLVLSRRAVLEREREEAREQLFESLQPGQVHEGVVRNIRDFGAFVDLGGVDGLIHVSQLSWDRIGHPNQVLEEGQRVKVKIDKIDRETGKIGLSYRDMLQNPWENVQEKYPVNSIVTGRVSKIMDFGAFVRLEAGVEGLIHVSELAFHRVHRVDTIVRVDQEVEVKVLAVDPEAQRISLSLKEAQAAAREEEAPSEAPAEESEPESAEPTPGRPRSTKPLKGGTEGSSGGEKFGLQW